MATKFMRLLQNVKKDSVLFSSWMTAMGVNVKDQYAYCRSGWLERLSKGVYKLKSSEPSLLSVITSYNRQLHKQCHIGAFSTFDLTGGSHYIPMGKPQLFVFTAGSERLPEWMTAMQWDFDLRYNTSSFISIPGLGIEMYDYDNQQLLMASKERAILECLWLPGSEHYLLDIYYILESQTVLRPDLLQQLLENCNSVKVKRLFLYMAEKTNYKWFRTLDTSQIDLGRGRRMISKTGSYIKKYNMTIPKELAEYE